MSARLRATLVAALAAAGSLASAAPALAASRVVEDKAGDVGVVGFADETGVTIDPARRQDDITSVRTAYRGGRVTITTRLRAVRRNPQVYAEVRTSAGGGRYAIAGLFAHGRPQVVVYRSADDDTSLSCDGLRARAKRAKGIVVLSVPASCLGSPRWVRTALATVAFDTPSPAEQAWPASFEDAQEIIDVAGMDGITAHWLKSRRTKLPLGPKVHRD